MIFLQIKASSRCESAVSAVLAVVPSPAELFTIKSVQKFRKRIRRGEGREGGREGGGENETRREADIELLEFNCQNWRDNSFITRRRRKSNRKLRTCVDIWQTNIIYENREHIYIYIYGNHNIWWVQKFNLKLQSLLGETEQHGGGIDRARTCHWNGPWTAFKMATMEE